MQLEYEESKGFYKKLNGYVKDGQATISFNNAQLYEKSKLWKRLRQCKNWKVVEGELNKIKQNKYSKLQHFAEPKFASRLTGAEIYIVGS
jgi:hypothetical protein